jgi:integrase
LPTHLPSILISQGRDVEFVARQLGHSQTSNTLDTYSHLFDARRHAEQTRAALEVAGSNPAVPIE